MCGRFNLTAPNQEITGHFALDRFPQHCISYNIAPGQKILTIVKRANGCIKSANLHWGLIPPWTKSLNSDLKLINARAETLTEKPSFRNAFERKRCLIPATGFFEWQKNGQDKQAYHIHLPEQSLFAFAGLWEHWSDNQQSIYSCTIITTAANQLMQNIHHRMPVIIAPQHYQDWLQVQPQTENIQSLLESRYNLNLKVTAISNRVNNPRHNDPECLK